MVCLVLKWSLSTAWGIQPEQASSRSGNKEKSMVAQCPRLKRDCGDLDVGDNGKMEKECLDPSVYALKLGVKRILD